jgi:hypothetical protein
VASGGDPIDAAVVVAGYLSELRDLHVTNTCADSSQIAAVISNDQQFVNIRRVTIRITNVFAAEPWGSWGIYNSGSVLGVSDVDIYVEGDYFSYGIFSTGGEFKLDRSEVKAKTLSGLDATGVYSDGNTPRFTDSEVVASGGLTHTYAIRGTGYKPEFHNVRAVVEDPGVTAIAINLDGCDDLDFTGVRATGGDIGVRLWIPSGSPSTTYGASFVDLASTGTETGLELDADAGTIAADIRNSMIDGGTNSISSAGSTVGIATSQLKGGPVAGTGFSCAAIVDESLTFYADSCP